MTGDADFWRMRDLLLTTVPLTPIGFNWDVRRLDGKRFYNADPDDNRLLRRPIYLWETGDGQMVGFVLAEGADDAHLQVHPDYRHLETEMIDWTMENLSLDDETGQRQLEIYVMEYDALRQRLLAESRLEKMTYGGMTRYLRLGHQSLTEPQLVDGYALRTTNPDDISDCQRIADLLNAAFHRNFHNAAEYQNFTRRAPSFHPNLDLVAVAPDGSFAGYVAIPYDERNRRGIFEPVCTHPDHQRLGLAKALMLEGLLRLQAMEAIDVTVDTGDMIPANSLYDSLGFTEAYKGYAWRKLD